MRYSLTISFATYNSGSYLNKFYESIFKQNLKNFEVVVVDDGSKDDSVDISLSWAKKYKNIKLIRQKNSGLSVARNRGILAATGKWLVMPDPDDLIYPGLYKHLLNIATLNNVDIAVINGEHLFENKKPKPIFNKKIPENKIMSGEDFLKFGLKSGSFLHTTWLNIYNLDFIKQKKIKFIPNLLHQDILWTTEVLFHAKRLIYSNQILYGYVHRGGSATRQKNSDGKNIKSIRNYCRILLLLNAFNVKNKGDLKNYNTFKFQISNEFTNIKRSLSRIRDVNKLIAVLDYLNEKKIFQLTIKNSTASLTVFKNLLVIFKYLALLKFKSLLKKI